MADTFPKPAPIESVSWLQQRLRQAAARRRATEVALLLCVSVALLILSVAAYELADWLVNFPRGVRLALTLGGFVTGVLALRRHVPRWIPSRQIGAGAMARLVEQAQEREGRQAHSRLVASIEFGERPEIHGDTKLKNRVIHEARSECADPCSLRLHNPRHVRAARRLGVAALVALAAMAIFFGDTRVFLQRMLGRQVYYPTATMLDSVDWQPVAPARQNYPVKVTVRGRIPSSGMLHVRMAGRRTLDLPLLATEGTNAFSTVIPAPEKSFSFAFRMADFESDRYEVRIAEPLYVKHGSIQVDPPAYTRLHKATEALGSLTAPEGSLLKFVIIPDREARAVNLIMDHNPLPLKREKDGAWVLTFDATNSFNYEISMQDEFGMQNADRLKRNVNIVPDNAPTVEVKQPKSDSFISVASLVPLEAQMRDDYGLTRLELSYDIQQRVNDKDVSVRKGVVPLEHVAVTGKFVHVEQILRVADLNVVPGQRIVFRVSSTDNRPGRPNVGQSSEIGLQVVDPDELKHVLTAEMTQMATLMRKLRDSEKMQEQTIAQRLLAEGGKP